MRAEQEKFREGLKTPQERKEDEEFRRRWLLQHDPVLKGMRQAPDGGAGMTASSAGIPAPGSMQLQLPEYHPDLQNKGFNLPKLHLKDEEDETLQRKESSATPSATHTQGVPPIVHDVLHSPGQPLERGTRTFMESRFNHDFSGVRVHADARAAESAHKVNALAYTVGRNVVFGAGQYSPNTMAGKRLLAHELTHTIQQSQTLPHTTGSEASLEAEATQAATKIAYEQSPVVSGSATPGQAQFERIKVRGKEYEVGDVHLNRQANIDVRQHGVLLPGPDQAKILVTGDGRLGYEVAHNNPDDPFRWQGLKEVVDNGHVDIAGISSSQNFRVKEVRAGKGSIVERNLLMFMAGGITLPRLSQQTAINPNAQVIAASANDSRDSIFYESGTGGRGMLGTNSLAHEFYGHLRLAMQGVPFRHGRQLTAQQGVKDPLGRPYSGTVDEYITQFAGASGTALQSPTQQVSTGHLEAALKWIMAKGASGLSLTNNIGAASSDFGLRWEVISGNYEILLVGPQTPAAPSLLSAGGLLNWIIGWYNSTLNDDQKRAFRSVLVGITTNFSSSRSRRSQLAQDVLSRIPRNP